MFEANKIYQGNCLDHMRDWEDQCIDCCITSPPYYGLRDYQVAEQIGLEETPELYVSKLVEVFSEVKRVLKRDGVLFLNLGDSYAGGNSIGRNDAGRNFTGGGGNILGSGNPGKQGEFKLGTGLKPKDLIGIPWMVAFALRSAGWYLRQDIIWAKPNPMPESVTDRCTKAHEYIFLLTKSQKYYYDGDAIKDDAKEDSYKRYSYGYIKHGFTQNVGSPTDKRNGTDKPPEKFNNLFGANKRSVWTVTTQPYPEAHFATFPEELIEPCVLAGCPEFVCNKCGKARIKIIESERLRRNQLDRNDPRYRPNTYNGAYENINGKGDAGYSVTTVTGYTDCGCNAGFSPGIIYDPFGGSGTTGVVALRAGRKFILSELNPDYCKLTEKRLKPYLLQLELF